MSKQQSPFDTLVEQLRASAFARAAPWVAPRIGAEVELLPLDAETGEVVPLHERLLPFLRSHARSRGWGEQASSKGAPNFVLPDGGALTFEPGGQVEYATPPHFTPGALLADVRDVIVALTRAADAKGIQLIGAGIDPFNRIENVPLQVDSERYRQMDEYLATIGTAGAHMMRQTASVQVNVDPVGDPHSTWRMLNAAAPYFTAMFANSSWHAGVNTGEASRRARMWRLLDPARTGVQPCRTDPAAEYARFALAAPVIGLRSEDGDHLPLADWLERGIGREVVDEHLTTLFPEVRPKGYFEVRSIDAIAPEWLAAPILLLAGLVMDTDALGESARLLGNPDAVLLACAGVAGMRDEHLADVCGRLAAIASAACQRQGRNFCSEQDLEEADQFFERYTRRGRSPADDSRIQDFVMMRR
ncbi:MAG: glutamate-cysteine ligase family protein [Longimicrobiales bacterium]